MKSLLIALLSLVVTGCNGITFNNNLGSYTSSKIVTAAVKEYSLAEIARYEAVSLGFVEASECQAKINEPKPSRSSLLRDLKVRAHNLGANGVVVEACGQTSAGTCLNYMECRGTAYSVPERQSSP